MPYRHPEQPETKPNWRKIKAAIGVTLVRIHAMRPDLPENANSEWQILAKLTVKRLDNPLLSIRELADLAVPHVLKSSCVPPWDCSDRG